MKPAMSKTEALRRATEIVYPVPRGCPEGPARDILNRALVELESSHAD